MLSLSGGGFSLAGTDAEETVISTSMIVQDFGVWVCGHVVVAGSHCVLVLPSHEELRPPGAGSIGPNTDSPGGFDLFGFWFVGQKPLGRRGF